ncbi:hypothetical protein Tco_0667292 [Tanacetum coccineum]
MKQNFYNSNSSSFDQFQPLQYSDEAILLQEQEAQKEQELLEQEQADEKNKNFKRIQQILERTSFDAITPDFPITDSLSIGGEHLSTILETKSNELIKSSVENLVPTPSESEDLSKDLSDIKSECNFDSLLEEFSGSLAHIDLIPPGINEADFDPEEDIHLVEKLLYDNSSPRPLEEQNPKVSDAVIKSFSASPILVEDRDILFLEELLSNDSPSLSENESFHFDVPSSPRPLVKLPDDGNYFEPDTGLLTAKVVGDMTAPDYEASRARGFVLHSLELHSLARL